MNLQEYLRDFKRWPGTLSQEEFEVSGLPDMGRKWIKKYRYVEVNVDAMRAVVAEQESRARAKADARGEVYVSKAGRRPVAKPQFARPMLNPATRVPAKLPRRAQAPRKRSTKAQFGAHAKDEAYDYANSPDFLMSFEWRKLRLETLRRYGAKCQCCGATPATGAVMNVDHIKPRKRRPDLALDPENLQVLCADCNHGKGNQEVDFRPHT